MGDLCRPLIPKPPEGGEPEEGGDEENEMESRRDVRDPSGVPTQITEWKRQWQAWAVDVFGGAKPTAPTPDLKTLHAKIGQLRLKNDFLAWALTKARLRSASAGTRRSNGTASGGWHCRMTGKKCVHLLDHARKRAGIS